MFTLYKVKIYFQKGSKREDDSAGVLSMLKKRINPSPSLSRNGLQSYIILAATLILFEKTPHLLHSAFAHHPPPPTRPHWSTPLGQEKFLCKNS
jgi:hypothetical protein